MKHPRKPHKPRASAWGLSKDYTLWDELAADPNAPQPPAEYADRVRLARDAVVALADPATATVTAWSVCCMVGNVIETMLRAGLASDPDGLLQDAFLALREGAASFDAGRGAIALSPAQRAAVSGMVEDWAAILAHAPARDVIRCYRATARRVAEIEAGRTQPGDFVLNTAPRKVLP